MVNKSYLLRKSKFATKALGLSAKKLNRDVCLVRLNLV